MFINDVPPIVLHPKSHLGWRDRTTVNNIVAKMQETHGHDDQRVMEAEILRGVSANDLIRMKCTICFKPRGQQEDDEL